MAGVRQTWNDEASTQLAEMLVDTGLATKHMPPYGMSAEEAWIAAASLLSAIWSKELYHLGLITREQGGSILKAMGLDPKDATGGEGKKGWPDSPAVGAKRKR